MILLRTLSTQIIRFIHILYETNQCIVCRTYPAPFRNALCKECSCNIQYVAPGICRVGKKEIPIHALGAYSGTLARLIRSKYSRNPQPFWFLGEWIGESFKQHNLHFDYIVPVPLHYIKRGLRWFNQTEEMADSMSKILSIPILNTLRRTRMTATQASSGNLSERQKNTEGTFVLNSENLIKGKSLLIVDDVYTSGTTMKEVVRTLSKGSPANIMIAVAARTI